MLESLMGAQRVGDEDRFELRGQRRGGWIAFDEAPAERGRQSAGTVHHVAWGTDDDDQPGWIDTLTEAGVPNSGSSTGTTSTRSTSASRAGSCTSSPTEEPGFTVDGLPVAGARHAR